MRLKYFQKLENIGSHINMQTQTGSSSSTAVAARVTSNCAIMTVFVTM